MSVVNLVPLLCGPRLGLVTKILGISFRTSIGSHQWIGRTAIFQAVLHMILSLAQGPKFSWTPNTVSGVVGSTALAGIALFSFRIFKQAVYEFFLNAHTILTLVLMITLWYHVPPRKSAAVFVRIGLCFWSFSIFMHSITFAFRNLAFRRPFARAIVTRRAENRALTMQSSILQVDITVPRSWEVRAGQYIFLSTPTIGGLAGLRGHPFMISWWNWDRSGLQISLLVKSQRGLTTELEKHSNQQLLAFIDGPYGSCHDFGEYGTVILFATGIGIAGHLPYIKELVRGYNACEVKTRRVLLVWQIKEEYHEEWAKHWLDEVMKDDTGYLMLKVEDHGKGDIEYSSHPKITKNGGLADVEDILEGEFKTRPGKVIVSVCADRSLADRARRHVQRSMGREVRLVELDFQPSHHQFTNPFVSDLEFKCKG